MLEPEPSLGLNVIAKTVRHNFLLSHNCFWFIEPVISSWSYHSVEVWAVIASKIYGSEEMTSAMTCKAVTFSSNVANLWCSVRKLPVLTWAEYLLSHGHLPPMPRAHTNWETETGPVNVWCDVWPLLTCKRLNLGHMRYPIATECVNVKYPLNLLV